MLLHPCTVTSDDLSHTIKQWATSFTTQQYLGCPRTQQISWSHYCVSSAVIPQTLPPFSSLVFKDKSPLLSFAHISRIEARRCHPAIVCVVLAPCWAHYWFFWSGMPPSWPLNAATGAFCVPPQTGISVLQLILRHLDYIFIFRTGAWSRPPSLLGRVTFFSLPSLFPITVTTADEMAVQHGDLSFGQLFLMKHHREKDNCAVPCCVCNICTGTIV